ncbi:hypothetical protein [Streptomyces sp. NPDC048172]|uniref:hypothetical protein n=1 Tax=Streptomyces sp. NPDC048172 TaxID=3365505 RepID=UPI003723FFA8
MLSETLITLAASGGTAVVQAAGTDAWSSFRQAVARWFGLGDAARERAELERLDRTAGEVEVAGDDSERVTSRQEAAWQARFEMVLESQDASGQERMADALRSLLSEHAPASRGGVASASGSGQAVGGNVTLRADLGSVAALRVRDVHLGSPSQPGTEQGRP